MFTQYTFFKIKKEKHSAAMGFFFKELQNEFETAVVNEPSVFEPLKIYTAKNIRIFYGKITGNQLPVYFPFYTGARKHFHESGTVR